MAARSLSVALPPDAREELARRAARDKTSLSHAAAAAACRGLGIDEPPRPNRRSADQYVPMVARACLDGATTAQVADALDVHVSVAQSWIRAARSGGIVTGRKLKRSGTAGSAPQAYTTTALGRRVAETAN